MVKYDNELIRFDQVNYSNGDVHILKNITGSFLEGKITTLVGPSGAGKTTLLKLCNELISADSGSIYFNNKRLEDYNPIELRRQVGLALQSSAMISGTVCDNLSLPLTLKGEKMDEEKAIELLQLVGLEKNFLYQDVRDLSGGQRQKLSIARTLVNQPKVLLLDEITSSLDRVSQQEIEKLILKINKEYRTTIIWITHDLEQAISIGDYTWVMMGGEVIETGESSLLYHTNDVRVKRFVKGDVK